MINFNTILYFNDSINVLPKDSPARSSGVLNVDTTMVLDTLKPNIQAANIYKIPQLFTPSDSLIDSTRIADTIQTTNNFPVGFPGILHPSLPQSENWVFGIIMILFLIFVISISNSSGLIGETIKSIFQGNTRSSIFGKTTINDFRFKFFLILFSIGVISLYSYLALYKSSAPFGMETFGLVLAITLLYFGSKSILFDIIGYVFFDPATVKLIKNSYFNILAFLGIALFPLLIIQIYSPDSFFNLTFYISVSVCVIAFIMVVIKLFQIFFNKTVAFFYIMLYLCTLEFLPLISLYLVYKLTIN